MAPAQGDTEDAHAVSKAQATMILPEAMKALLEQVKPDQSRFPQRGIACDGHEQTKDQLHSSEGVCMSVSERLRARTGMLVMVDVCLLGTTPASAAGGIGSGRLVPAIAAVVGLISVIVGGLSLARSAGRVGTDSGRRGAIVAAVAGLISAAVGGLHAANAAGGIGTGNGLAGAIVAMLVGLIGMVLGGLALARARRTAASSHR